MIIRRILAGALAAAVALLVAGAAPVAAGPTTDPATAASFGAGWLARQVNAQGDVAGSGGPDLSATANAALALAAAGVGGDAFTRAVGYLHAHINDYVVGSGGDKPAALGTLVLVAVAAGEDPTAFGGSGPSHDLVARLLATKQTSGTDKGLFGSQSPTYDGAYRQSLGLLGLAAAGHTDADAVTWLKGQQCPDKGWQAYRADTSQPCTPTDLTTFAGEDTNSTATAEEALRALHATPAKGDPLDWLDGAQNADGGFGYLQGGATDADSTGLVLQAIVAGGEHPAAGRWVTSGGTPDAALLALQVGCAGAAADRGAFDYQQESPLRANGLATQQAVPGAAGAPFPLSARRLSATEPTVACTTSSTAGSTVASTTTTTTAATRVAPEQVAATAATLPRTGGGRGTADARTLAYVGFALAGAGAFLVAGTSRRRAARVRGAGRSRF